VKKSVSLLATLALTTTLSAREYPATVDLPLLPDAIANYCFECHDSASAEAEIDLESLENGSLDPYHAARLLDEICLVVESQDMPPQKADQPDEVERSAMLTWVEAQIDRLAETYQDDPGVVVMPRLTGYEYRNVMRDLTGGVVSNAGRYLPNEGGAGEGFANVGLAQGMTATHLERYFEAAKDVLRHLTVTPAGGMTWRETARPDAGSPAVLRQQVIDDIIAWYVAQQQKWNAEHQQHLSDTIGRSHAAYLEAAWHFRHREAMGRGDEALEAFAECEGQPLAPVALEKWWAILNDESREGVFADWAAAWREIPGPSEIEEEALRRECIAITLGERGGSLEVNKEDYAPKYEISFHEAKDEVLESARKDGIWPFRIDIGNARELFLVVTDAGDGQRGEYAVWRRGRFLFQDGSAKKWEDAVTLIGANSGREYPFGIDGEGTKNLPGNAIGVKPPGALKFAVPEGAYLFEVDLTLDENREGKMSIQALVLKEKPKSQSYIPNRYVFGGKARAADAQNEENKQRTRALRKRNVSEANKTKIGLNAERNVFANWDRTPIEFLGGPWQDHDADKEEPEFPYHYTAPQIRRNATSDDLAELRALEDQLFSVLQVPQQRLYTFLMEGGVETVKEGVLPPVEITKGWPEERVADYERLHRTVVDHNDHLEAIAMPKLESFARIAWRRELTKTDLKMLRSLYVDTRSRGYSFDASVKAALMFVLNSPDFLYRHGAPAHDTKPGSVHALTEHQLANRLAFFLWASIPDQELIDLAEAGALSDSKTLVQQAQRMLRDPRAQSLSTDFAGQLWGFDGFESFTNPDNEKFSEFTSELRADMLGETTAFLDDLFRNDRPLTALLDADYTFANSRIARHYGIDGVTGDEFRRVEVDPDQRGGLAGMGLFLTKTSLPLRTSPVQRGVWVLEQVMGRELPSPPANVDPLSEGETDEKGQSILQQLEAHRADAGCASCHNKIDPLGIALENFDPIGRWRESEINTATAHDGTELSGMAGIKAYLSSKQDDVFAHFNRKLLGYALGRSVGPGDRRLLREMQEALESDGYRFSSLIECIVLSPQFTQARSPNKS